MTNQESQPGHGAAGQGGAGHGAAGAADADVSPASGPPAAGGSQALQIEPWLREILRCPKCRSTLTDGVGPTGPELHCTNPQCRLGYRVDDGIPVLLVDESRSLAG